MPSTLMLLEKLRGGGPKIFDSKTYKPGQMEEFVHNEERQDDIPHDGYFFIFSYLNS